MLAEDNYQVALIRLKQCRREFGKLTAGCPDFAAVIAVNEAFEDLLDQLRRFAQCHYGIGVGHVRPTTPTHSRRTTAQHNYNNRQNQPVLWT